MDVSHREVIAGRSAPPGWWPARLAFWLALGLALGSACATTHPHFDYASEPDPSKHEYVLGPSDTLRISVWHNADLTGEATVRPDGTISVPLVGDLRAAGRTPGQVRADLVQRMATFIKEEGAIVTVVVMGINSYRFIVSGNAERAGVYTANHYVTVVEAFAMSGGPNKFGSPEDSVLIRTDPVHGTRRIPIDYPAILSGVHPEQNLTLISGDILFIP